MTDDAFVRFVQQALADRGHYKGAIDGKAGDGTFSALTAALGPAPVPVVEPAAPAGARALDAKSLRKLEGVHRDLANVVGRAIELAPFPFVVLEGLRSVERQRQLVAQGASKTMRSRHLNGHAVDLAPLRPDGSVSWDWPLYHKLAPTMKAAAKELGIPIEWGGDWKSFKDGPHWQLPWSAYP